MNTATEQQTTNHMVHESASGEHRLRSERIAARGVRLGKGKIKYLLALAGLAVLASVAFAQA